MKPTQLIWHNGELKPWFEATTHVLTHALHYGSSVFEGIRVYDHLGEPAGFRMREHLQRMHDSARIYRMEIPYTVTARRDTGLWNAKIGIWLFLASEVMLFGGLFSAYVFLRMGVIEGFDNPWPTRRLVVWQRGPLRVPGTGQPPS